MPYADRPYEPKIEEETDDDDYVDDDASIEVDSDSSDALSMLDENFEDTDPLKIDDALQQIVKGLRQAADGFEALKDLLPTVPVTDVAKIVQVAPTPRASPLLNEQDLAAFMQSAYCLSAPYACMTRLKIDSFLMEVNYLEDLFNVVF